MESMDMEVTIRGCRINYTIAGDGEDTIVILQGWGTSLAVYDSIARFLSARYRVVSFDFPGFGQSDEPKEAWDVDGYADFFEDFMAELGIKKAILMGHSYGGRVIIKLANRSSLSFEIDRIVLIDSAGIMPKRTFKQKFKQRKFKILKKIVNFKPIHAICPRLIEDWKSRQGSADYRNASPIMKQCMVKAINEDLTGLLGGVDKEVLLVWGDLDTATPIADGKLMESMMPNAGLAVIKGAGHFCFLDNPAVFFGIMKSYFKI